MVFIEVQPTEVYFHPEEKAAYFDKVLIGGVPIYHNYGTRENPTPHPRTFDETVVANYLPTYLQHLIDLRGVAIQVLGDLTPEDRIDSKNVEIFPPFRDNMSLEGLSLVELQLRRHQLREKIDKLSENKNRIEKMRKTKGISEADKDKVEDYLACCKVAIDYYSKMLESAVFSPKTEKEEKKDKVIEAKVLAISDAAPENAQKLPPPPLQDDER